MAFSEGKFNLEENVKVSHQNNDSEHQEVMLMEVDDIIEELDLKTLRNNHEEQDQDVEIFNQFGNGPCDEEHQKNKKFRKLVMENRSYQFNDIDKSSSQIPEVTHETEIKWASQLTEVNHKTEINANKIEKIQEEIQQGKVDTDIWKAENENKIEKIKKELQQVKVDYNNLKSESENKIRNMQAEIQQVKADNVNLKMENEQCKERLSNLEDRGLCIACLTEQINCWLIPCQHWVLCSSCCRYILNGDRKCPMCRKYLQGASMFYGK